MSAAGRLAALEGSGIKLGLSNIATITAALGHPERAYPTIHVAGTNGKGSVVAMVHGALAAAGYRTGRYTSPHLVTIRERFVIGDAMVDDATFDAVATDVLDRIDTLVAAGTLAGPPTFFEATTAVGFEVFRRAGVDAAVIEVGLGGRFDSTNVIQPDITAITSIALDHEAFLGGNRAAIAFEKAGILKPGVPAVLGPVTAEADAVIRAVALERGAPVIDARQPGDQILDMVDGHAPVVPGTGCLAGQRLVPGLAGAHQAGNALVAYRILDALAGRGLRRLSAGAIRTGIETARWPGRLETLTRPDGRRLLLDAAHNPEGAAALAAHLRACYPERPLLLFAAMQDKDIAGMLAPLLPEVGPIVLAPMDTPRSAQPDAVAAIIRAHDAARAITLAADVPSAVALALDAASTVVVAGSIVLLGAVRECPDVRAILR